ncbi:MAG: mycothiol system anti-sigma-R factor [Propioniciclava sp.]|uniref:mycothiol system anti-sigma-R factor n=1 Tax=Propioniciclava sp. TaxID=2038686 RepID=UPI0039E55A09
MSEPIDCRYVADRINRFLDGELSEAEADELRLHIDACAHCLDETDLMDAIKRLVNRACGCAQAPETLRARIVTQIHRVSYTRIEITEIG